VPFTLPRPKAVLILLALVVTPLAVLLADPGRLAAWQTGGAPEPATWTEIEQTAEELERGWDQYEARSQVNQDLVAGVAAGRLTLPQSANLYWETNRDVKGFRALIHRTWDGDSEEAARLNMLRLVRVYLHRDSSQAAVTARLVAEYERAYGPFPLTSADELDRW
jgi:hypothetical protein